MSAGKSQAPAAAFVLLSLVLTSLPTGAQVSRMGHLNAMEPGDTRFISTRTCPKDLSHLRGEIEEILKPFSVPEFKQAIRSSLTASIPEAIHQADGILAQIAFLRRDILEQEFIQRDAEQIAREASANPSGPLTPCPKGEKGSYCSAVERYNMALAANLANRAFLDALECYRQEGVR